MVHFHHGVSEKFKIQSDYRDKAYSFVETLCTDNSVEFIKIKSPHYLESEVECRDFRLTAYEELKTERSRIFLAHHKDDLFETLLIRLVRGTGPEGFKEPFLAFLERPLVQICGRVELETYQKDKSVAYIEDPSNQENKHLRNWLRNDWLKSLEQTPHGLGAFKNSLIKLSDYVSQSESNFKNVLFFEHKNKGYFNFLDYMNYNQVQKKTLISKALHKLKKTGYTSGQVSEVLKRLEQDRSSLEFITSGVKWNKTETKVYFEKA
jgi:tRNA(Ile)-lysidine synthase